VLILDRCVSSASGEFAFVLWDETNRTIFAARDRFGIKPLFYAFYGGTLYFASEVKALFAAGVPARWDAESVYHSVCLTAKGALFIDEVLSGDRLFRCSSARNSTASDAPVSVFPICVDRSGLALGNLVSPGTPESPPPSGKPLSPGQRRRIVL
jgi:asparagine synthetase B (glutamine-hydrolysing)